MARAREREEERSEGRSELDDFLEHPGSGGSFGGFLKNWKDDGRIDLWLHPGGPPKWVWANRWFAIGRDRQTGEDKLRYIRFNSYEAESVIKRRFARNRDGTLEVPPEVCPFAKMLEWVWQAIATGTIGIADEVFRFELGDEDDDLVLHAGGFCGYFGRKDLSERQKKEMKRAGIRLNEAWKENCGPRLQYIFRVVLKDRPDDGCLIAMESEALGKRMKKVIQDRKDDVGKVLGDPLVTPYMFRWLYDDRQQFSEKYDAKAITSAELPDEVREVFAQPAPSLDEILKLSSIAELRMGFEEFWCHDVVPPWDELFEEAERRFPEQSADPGKPPADEDEDEDDDEDDPHNRKAVEDVRRQRAREREAKAEPASKPIFRHSRDEPEKEVREAFGAGQGDDDFPPEPPKESKPERERVMCDVCDKTMYADESTCPHCKARYDADGNLVDDKPEPPPARRRSGKGGR